MGVNDCDEAGHTALHRAVAGGHFLAARFLLEAGATATLRDRAGLTPLHWAAVSPEITRKHPMLQLLLDAGADPDAAAADGQTVAGYATAHGFKRTADWLGSKGSGRRVGGGGGAGGSVKWSVGGWLAGLLEPFRRRDGGWLCVLWFYSSIAVGLAVFVSAL